MRQEKCRGNRNIAQEPKRRRPVKGTGSQLVYDFLRSQILNLDRKPGSTINELALVEEIGISRTPVREAIIRLASEELVTILPNRGAMVAPLNLTDFPRFLEAFDLVQRAVTRLAALRRTGSQLADIAEQQRAFENAAARADPVATTIANSTYHNAIGAAAGNRFLCDQYARLLNLSMRYSRFPFGTEAYEGSTEDLRAHLHRVMEDHRAMTRAIDAGDANAAEALAHDHMVLFRDRITKYLHDNKTSAIACAPSDAAAE